MRAGLFTTSNLLIGAGALAVAVVGGSALYTSLKKPPPDERAAMADAAFTQVDKDAAKEKEVSASTSGEGGFAEVAATNSLCPEDMVGIAERQGGLEVCGNGRPPVVAPNPLDGIWEVDSPGNPKINALTIFMHSAYGILHRTDPNQPSPAHGVWRLIGAGQYKSSTFSIRLAVAEDGVVGTGAGQFGFSNRMQVKWQVKPTSDPNTMIGDWRFGDEQGISIWRRRSGKGVIRSVKIHSAFSNDAGEWTDDQFGYGSRAGRLERAHPVTCGYGGMRGNCGSVWVTVLGENFVGAHDVWVDPAARFELWEARWVCKNGKTTGSGHWDRCGIGAVPGDTVAGIQFKLNLWDGMKPGPINIWVDDLPIPVDVTLHGYPEEETEQRPSLVLLDAQNSGGEQLTQVKEGEPFVVKAIYDGAHPDAWVSIDVPGFQTLPDEVTNGRALILQRTQDLKTFQSDWLAVEAGEIHPAP